MDPALLLFAVGLLGIGVVMGWLLRGEDDAL